MKTTSNLSSSTQNQCPSAPRQPPASSLKHKVAFAMIMGVVTTGVISFTLISLNLGFNERFLRSWLKSWGVGYLVVIPAILILGPMVQRLVDGLLAKRAGGRA